MPKTPATWTVLSMLEWATSYFEQKHINNPRLSIEWLLSDVLNIKRLDLYLNYDRPLSSDELNSLRPLVKRRANYEPLQYIIGYTDFYNAKIEVNQSVLIPRPETEQLIQIILDTYKNEDALKLIDLGTGSGCIPIALKKERPNWDVWATDISEDALKTAHKNAINNNVDINFLKQDLFRPQFENQNIEFDIIISNPPYILPDEADSLSQEVLNYEPHLALFCKNTEHIFSAIEKYCQSYLSKSGKAYFELHENEGNTTAAIFARQQWHTLLIKDFDNKDRFLAVKR